MAQATSPTAGQKRGPGRPTKAAQPALKKARTSTPLSSTVQSPTAESPTSDKRSNKLPSKISETRPLPTLPEAQPPNLSTTDYQSIASSAVLETSLHRSRLKWINEGIFERYWVKPESGKHARPPPPNNPELKWQKHKGPCRIRIEPHIFEVEIYVEEKPKPAPVKQYAPPQTSAYGQPYRPTPQQTYGGQQNQYYQNRPLPPVQQTMAQGAVTTNATSPAPSMTNSPQPQAVARTQQTPASASPQPGQGDKKTSDPVIGMLATRASTDPELKALMKEVATGQATQAQLEVFQKHINDLNKSIADKKKKDEEAEAAAQAAKEREAQNEMIQYDGSNDRPPQPQQPPVQQPFQPYQQPTYATPPRPEPTTQPVILAFTTPGATEDRFLFPQHAILESLSPQHLLASFIVTRKGSAAADAALFEPGVEYWQPVTLMVEVAYNREHLIECVKKWVKPKEEVRRWMEGVMGRCRRVPEGWLALRLPVKGGKEEAVGEEVEEVVPSVVEKRKGMNVKFVKKAPVKKDEIAKGKGEGASGGAVKDAAPPVEGKGKDGAGVKEGEDGKADVQETTESGRPRRAVRKSVRISEG
ncbi:uncharacterized protein LTR77_003725 [Saxophila tyrrhenica]|uniref:SWR1-complex protein 3 domain-containing protein n=1 Tax=Saxophila tyrrhenica TaxID=1690608 RepID=A0AAV9PFZ8_9PEZI|nr:hypothetical protein LTR77_003725 [Saxophila tyrrhenica]